MSDFAKRLTNMFKRAGLSSAKVSELSYDYGLDTSKKTVDAYRSGLRTPSPDFISFALNICGEKDANMLFSDNPNKIAKAEQAKDDIMYIDAFSMPAGCGSSGVFDNNFEVENRLAIHKSVLELYYPNPKFIKAFRCFGDSMEPEYYDGDFVIVEMVAGRHFQPIDGIYVFRVDDTVMVKKLAFLGKKVKAISMNSSYGEFMIDPEVDSFEILAKVCGKLSLKSGLLLNDQGIN